MTISTQSNSISVASLIAARQSELHVSDEQLAMAAGFDRSNMVAMIKAGTLKLPANKVAALAAALSVDPAYLLRTFMAEVMPEVLAAVDALLTPKLMTVNEIKLLESYRYLSKGHDISPVVMDGTNIVALLAV